MGNDNLIFDGDVVSVYGNGFTFENVIVLHSPRGLGDFWILKGDDRLIYLQTFFYIEKV